MELNFNSFLLHNGVYIALERLSHFVFRATTRTIIIIIIIAVMIVTITAIIAMIHIFQTIRSITVPRYEAVLERAGNSRL